MKLKIMCEGKEKHKHILPALLKKGFYISRRCYDKEKLLLVFDLAEGVQIDFQWLSQLLDDDLNINWVSDDSVANLPAIVIEETSEITLELELPNGTVYDLPDDGELIIPAKVRLINKENTPIVIATDREMPFELDVSDLKNEMVVLIQPGVRSQAEFIIQPGTEAVADMSVRCGEFRGNLLFNAKTVTLPDGNILATSPVKITIR